MGKNRAKNESIYEAECAAREHKEAEKAAYYKPLTDKLIDLGIDPYLLMLLVEYVNDGDIKR